jgi:integrase
MSRGPSLETSRPTSGLQPHAHTWVGREMTRPFVRTATYAADQVFLRAEREAWGKSHQKRPLEEANARGGSTPAVNFHILRHTHGSYLAMNGVPMGVIAAQLGHADTRMTEKHYAHLAPSYVAQTIRANFPRLNLEEGRAKIVRLAARLGTQ